MRDIYLDNNATTRVDPRVVDAMLPFFTEQFGNASSMHSFGSKVGGALKAARQQVQALLGAEFDHEVVFTSGGSESDNTAILSALETQRGRTEVVTSMVEHPAILSLCKYLEQTRKTKVHYVSVDARGRLNMDEYRKALGPQTAIASIRISSPSTTSRFRLDASARAG